MILTGCHIENFGKLSDLQINFSEGLNAVQKENGWGKSTLSAFIRAMFYGLEGDNKRDEISSERKRYNPWQGGAFGGSLSFIVKNKEYVITRIFGSKPSEDRFELRDKITNLHSSDYSEKIGEELFGIDSESFMKTAFIGQSEVSNFRATDDVNAKLGNITEAMDLNKYEAFESCIKDTLNALSPTRKTGEIARLKQRISELKASVRKGSELPKSIDILEKRIAAEKEAGKDKKEALAVLSAKKESASKYEKLFDLKKNYDALLAEYSKKQSLLSEKLSRFNGIAPKKETIYELEDAVETAKKQAALLESVSLSTEEKEALDEGQVLFEKGLPDNEKLNKLAYDAVRLSEYRNEFEKLLLTEEEAEKLNGFLEKFGDEASVMEDARALLNDFNESRKMLKDKAVLEKELAKKETNFIENDVKRSFGFVSVLFLVLGVVAFFFLPNLLYVSVTLVAVGVLVGVLCMLQSGRKNSYARATAAELNEIREEISSLSDEILDIENDVAGLLYDFDMEYEDSTAASRIQDIILYLHDMEGLIEKDRKVSAYSHYEELLRLEDTVSDYLNRFGITGSDDPSFLVLTLKSKADNYRKAYVKKTEYDRIKADIQGIFEFLCKKLTELNITPGEDILLQIDNLLDDYAEYKDINTLFEDVYNRRKEFEASIDVRVLSSENLERLPTLKAIDDEETILLNQLEEIRNRLFEDEKTYEGLLASYDSYMEDCELLSTLEEELSNKEKKYALIEKAGSFMAMAREALIAKYMEPLFSEFSRFYEILTGEDPSLYKIDVNANITREEKGRQRIAESLSLGYRDLIGFCMRLATVHAMYEEEKPFLILDDPFVNLDDKKMEGAKKLLNEALSDYQVIYLTCRAKNHPLKDFGNNY